MREYGDGWGPGFREDDGYDSDESESNVTESMILEAFEILGLDPKTELTRKNLIEHILLHIDESAFR